MATRRGRFNVASMEHMDKKHTERKSKEDRTALHDERNFRESQIILRETKVVEPKRKCADQQRRKGEGVGKTVRHLDPCISPGYGTAKVPLEPESCAKHSRSRMQYNRFDVPDQTF
jgi:hypothetical protein